MVMRRVLRHKASLQIGSKEATPVNFATYELELQRLIVFDRWILQLINVNLIRLPVVRVFVIHEQLWSEASQCVWTGANRRIISEFGGIASTGENVLRDNKRFA